ncbi:MAG: hypothetical protein QOF76_647 [Solirubrobacteraceae bacterium]|jgi:ElaB/YqjD/DUF883 family membrane-anchored ribosome-binding protein|nr:hypothetical protein [Solirubrobacteraceae bacterium]
MSNDHSTQTPDEIRADIDQTREDLGDTVEALAAKTDVKGQAHAKVEDIKDNVRQSAEDAKAKVRDSTPAGAQDGVQTAAAKVRQNPLPVAVSLALVLGFLIGRGRS